MALIWFVGQINSNTPNESFEKSDQNFDGFEFFESNMVINNNIDTIVQIQIIDSYGYED